MLVQRRWRKVRRGEDEVSEGGEVTEMGVSGRDQSRMKRCKWEGVGEVKSGRK